MTPLASDDAPLGASSNEMQPMAQTFKQMAEKAIAQVKTASAKLANDANALLIDTRNAAKGEATGLGTQTFNAPGLSPALLTSLFISDTLGN